MASVKMTSANKPKERVGRTCANCSYLGWADPTFSGVLGQVTRIQRQKIREWEKDAPGFNNLACQKGLKAPREIQQMRPGDACAGWKAYGGGIGPQLALQFERDGQKLRRMVAVIVLAVAVLAVILFLVWR